jgi:hypothetical protein
LNSDLSAVKDNVEFMAHVLCAIAWHIHENDTLSSLSPGDSAFTNAAKTKAGSKWLAQNGHKKLSFDKTWVNHFSTCEDKGAIPLEFERAMKFIKTLVSGSPRLVSELEFANFLIVAKSKSMSSLGSNEAAVGL